MNQKWQSLVLLLAVQSATAGAEQIYRWQDEAGRWHFAGEQSAPQSASPVTDEAAISVVKMKRLAEPPAAGGGDATNKKRASAERAKKVPDIVRERERRRVRCERWGERLRHSRLGLRDHEGQDAYDRECIQKVRW